MEGTSTVVFSVAIDVLRIVTLGTFASVGRFIVSDSVLAGSRLSSEPSAVLLDVSVSCSDVMGNAGGN